MDNSDEDEMSQPKATKLVGGITLKDVMDKGALFDTDQNFYDFDEREKLDDDYYNVSGDEFEESEDLSKLNIDEGISFETLIQTMESIEPKGYLWKKIIKKGNGTKVPDRSFVYTHFNFYRENDMAPYDSSYRKGKVHRFRLGAANVQPALDYAVLSMKKKEIAMFIVHWQLGYGELGVPPRIPPRAYLMYHINLLDYDESPALADSDDYKKVDFEKSITEAKILHQKGNDLFRQGNYQGSKKKYFQACSILQNLTLADEKQEREMLLLKRKCHGNIAVAALKLNQPQLACSSCQIVLSIDDNNTKALCNYGKANLMLSNFTQARKWLNLAKNLEPNNREIQEVLKQLDKKKKDYDIKYNSMCRKIFDQDPVVQKPIQKEDTFLGFEESLNLSLKEMLEDKDSKPIKLPKELTKQEKEICEKLAVDMGCQFISCDSGNVIKKLNS